MAGEYGALYFNAQPSVVTALIFIDFNDRLPILNICDSYLHRIVKLREPISLLSETAIR